VPAFPRGTASPGGPGLRDAGWLRDGGPETLSARGLGQGVRRTLSR
jgi:hypothetical protein